MRVDADVSDVPASSPRRNSGILSLPKAGVFIPLSIESNEKSIFYISVTLYLVTEYVLSMYLSVWSKLGLFLKVNMLLIVVLLMYYSTANIGQFSLSFSVRWKLSLKYYF